MTTFIARLPSRASLVLEGPDGRKFLQGQTTCDVDQLSAECSLVGAYCNPQGRMVCDFRLLELAPDTLLLSLDAGAASATLDTFGKYIVFSKAELRNASEDWCHYALWGPEAAALAGAPGSTAHICWRQRDIWWVANDADGVFEACVPAGGAEAFAASLVDQGAQAAAEEQFRLLEIQAGIGHVTGATSGEFLPQMLNFQATERISFTKGCYTGQEVVARMHYRGRVKRPMALASVALGGDVLPGDSIRDAADKAVGNVVEAARDGDGQWWLLASLTREAMTAGASLAGSPLTFHALPYALDEDEGSST